MSKRTTATSSIAGIAGLLAVVLTANMAGAEKSSHYRQFRASAPERSLGANNAPAYPSRYDRVTSAVSRVTPASGRGIFEEFLSAP